MLLYYFVSSLKSAQLRFDDDIVDKINYHYTSSMIIVFAILVSTKQFVGHPIRCWVPATFTLPMEQYVENFCWIQNTYFLSVHDDVPQNTLHRDNLKLGYYQWVPFVLCLKALLFFLPCLIWRLLNWQTGLNVQSLMQMANDARLLDTESRLKAMQIIAANMEDALNVRNDKKSDAKFIRSRFLCAQNSAAGVTCLYLFVKLFYCLNVFAQLFLLTATLGIDDAFYGIHVLEDLLANRDWQQSGHFPRVTLCDFEVKGVGNVHRHTVQCLLMINMFNEKIFLILWFWYLLLGAASLLSFLHWAFISLISTQRTNFVRRYLTGLEGYRMVDNHALKQFTTTTLRHDGVFVLRMTAMHAGDLVCCELSKTLWANYCSNKENVSVRYEKRYKSVVGELAKFAGRQATRELGIDIVENF